MKGAMLSKLIWGGVLLGLSVLSASAQVQSPIPPTYFGMHFQNTMLPWPALPIGSVRAVDYWWGSINTGSGTYDWSAFDGLVAMVTAANQANGTNVDIVFDLGSTPPWASSAPNQSPCAWGVNGTCAPPDPAHPEYWTNWVTMAVQHGKGTVKYWEIWNEPNDSVFWIGDIPTMVALAQTAYGIIKSIDPNAKVLTPAVYSDPSGMLPHNGVAWLSEFLRQCSLPPAGSDTAKPCADILAYHGYAMNYPPIGVPPAYAPAPYEADTNPASYPLLAEQAVIDIQSYKNLAATYGLEAA